MANNTREVTFLSDQIGLAVRGDIWRSTDAGVTWARKIIGHYHCGVLREDGFAVVGGAQGTVAFSNDSGKTWSEKVLPGVDDLVAIASAGTGVLAASEDGALRLSNDKGKTWRPIDPPQPGYSVIDVEISNDMIWLLRRPSDEVIRVAAYSLWENRSADDERDEQAFWTSAEDQLNQAALAVSADHGATWTIPEGYYGAFSSLKLAPGGYTVLLTGLHSVQTFEGNAVRLPTWFPVWAVDVLDKDTYVCGGYDRSFGIIATSTDGGCSWHLVPLSDNGVRSIFIVDKLRARAVVGSYGGDMIWGTNDGGHSWECLTEPQMINFGGSETLALASPFSSYSSK